MPHERSGGEGERYRTLLEITNAIISNLAPQPLFQAIADALRRVIPFDRIGILPARRLCMLRAIEQLAVRPDAIVSDALDLPFPNVQAVVNGDALSVAVAAASVIAKVERDALMARYCLEYPGYGFSQHKGYPTPEQRRLLRELGPSPIHRRSFAPVAQLTLAW